MPLELTHDIIAQKIWEQLPEQDKQLQLVQSSFAKRFTDYERGSGSLLGDKELKLVDNYFKLLNLSSAQKQFINQSKKTKAKAEKTRRLAIIFLILLTISSLVAATIAFYNLDRANKKEEEARQSLKQLKQEQSAKALANYEKYMAEGKNAKQIEAFSRAIDLFELAKNFKTDSKEVTDLIAECQFSLKNQDQFDNLLSDANRYFNQGQYLTARTFFQNALKLRTNNAKARLGSSKNEEKLREQFNRLVEKGKVYLAVGTKTGYRDALRQFEVAIKIKPNDPLIEKQIQECKEKLKTL